VSEQTQSTTATNGAIAWAYMCKAPCGKESLLNRFYDTITEL